MNKFVLNGAGIVDTQAQVVRCINRASSIDDGRFAVVHGLLFDCVTVEFGGHTQAFVCVYDADGTFNPSEHTQLGASYNDKHFIVAFEFNTSCADEVEHLRMNELAEELFLHLQMHAMKNSNNARARFNNFARGLDLDHIQTVGHSVDQGESAHLGESVTERFAFAPCGLTSTGLAIVEAHPVDGESWSSDFALAVFEVNTQNSHYAQTKGEPVTLTGDEVSNLLQVAGEAS